MASHPLSDGLTALLFDVTDGVGVITLNRPDKYNSCDLALVTELEHLYTELRYDDSVKVVVLTGAGEKAFCTGIDRDFAMDNRQPDSPFMMDDPMLKLGPKQAGHHCRQRHVWRRRVLRAGRE